MDSEYEKMNFDFESDLAQNPKLEENDQVEKAPLDSEKPKASYVFMIQEAIKESSDGKMTLAAIYRYMEAKYPYFKQLTGKKRSSWQNSVRHNLSLNDCFIKLPKEEGGANDRKGSYWMLDKSAEDQFEPGNCKRRRRMRRVYDQPVPRDESFLMLSPHWATWQNLMPTNGSGPAAVDFFCPTPPQSAYSSPLSSLASLPTRLSNNTFYPPNPEFSTAALNSNGYRLPAATTLMNGKGHVPGPAIFPVGSCFYPTPMSLPTPNFNANTM